MRHNPGKRLHLKNLPFKNKIEMALTVSINTAALIYEWVALP